MGVAFLLGGVLVAASRMGGDEGTTPAPVVAGGELFGAASVERMLRGIPQDGTALGRRDAPVTLVEFADL